MLSKSVLKITSFSNREVANASAFSLLSDNTFLALSYCSSIILLTSSSISFDLSSEYGLVNPLFCPEES